MVMIELLLHLLLLRCWIKWQCGCSDVHILQLQVSINHVLSVLWRTQQLNHSLRGHLVSLARDNAGALGDLVGAQEFDALVHGLKGGQLRLRDCAVLRVREHDQLRLAVGETKQVATRVRFEELHGLREGEEPVENAGILERPHERYLSQRAFHQQPVPPKVLVLSLEGQPLERGGIFSDFLIIERL